MRRGASQSSPASQSASQYASQYEVLCFVGRVPASQYIHQARTYRENKMLVWMHAETHTRVILIGILQKHVDALGHWDAEEEV